MTSPKSSHASRVLMIVAVTLATALVAAACGGGDGGDGATSTSTAPSTPRSSIVPTIPGPPPTLASDGNMLGNPSFEDGMEPWVSLEPPDWVRDVGVAYEGDASALLPFSVPGPSEHSISYLVQEVTAEPFPEQISGWYRVDDWVRGTPKQYLQFVVIVFGADNAPEAIVPNWPEGAELNHQIRFPLVGIDSDPFFIANGKFVYITKDLEPENGEWIHFERALADEFREQWGAVPEGYERIRLLLEVRVDDKTENTTSSATVHYDDIYMGTPP